MRYIYGLNGKQWKEVTKEEFDKYPFAEREIFVGLSHTLYCILVA